MLTSTVKVLALRLTAFALMTSAVYADPATTPPPNQFVLRNGSVHVEYSTTGIDGIPHLDYREGSKVASFRGDQIRLEKTEIGDLVTVTLSAIPDLESNTLSLLIPKVNLDSSLETLIRTQGIKTKHKTAVSPNLLRGQLDNYTFLILKGTARAVNF